MAVKEFFAALEKGVTGGMSKTWIYVPPEVDEDGNPLEPETPPYSMETQMTPTDLAALRRLFDAVQDWRNDYDEAPPEGEDGMTLFDHGHAHHMKSVELARAWDDCDVATLLAALDAEPPGDTLDAWLRRPEVRETLRRCHEQDGADASAEIDALRALATRLETQP